MWAAKGEAKAKQKQKQKQSQSTCRHGFDLSTLRGSKKHADIKLNSLNLLLSDSFWCIFPSQNPTSQQENPTSQQESLQANRKLLQANRQTPTNQQESQHANRGSQHAPMRACNECKIGYEYEYSRQILKLELQFV